MLKTVLYDPVYAVLVKPAARRRFPSNLMERGCQGSLFLMLRWNYWELSSAGVSSGVASGQPPRLFQRLTIWQNNSVVRSVS